MQTFLPYEDFAQCARILDQRRLGKQRVETLQIMKALVTPGYGWQSHPAVKMWRGHEFVLLEYQLAICHEWHDIRGFKDTCYDKTFDIYDVAGPFNADNMERPPWLGNDALHLSHQSNLLRKDPVYYEQWFPSVAPDLEYVWPVA